MVSGALGLLMAMRLEDDVPWGERATPWQVKDARAIFDLDGPRRHFLTRPRGGSKTTDIAGCSLAWLATEAPPMAKGYVVAADADQASLLIDAAAGLVQRTPALRAAVTVQMLKLTNPASASVEVLSADGASAYGLLPHWLILDEYAQWPDTRNTRRLWAALFSSIQKVPTSRLVIMTSAGEPGHPSFRTLQKARESKRWRVSEIPGPLPWVPRDELEEQQAVLRESEYSRLHLNLWTQSEDRLVSEEDLAAACTLDGPVSPMPGRRYAVTVDLGAKKDSTVVVVAHAEPLSESPAAPRLIVVDRLMRWTPRKGRTLDFDEIEAYIETCSREYNRAPVHADPWQAIGMLQRLRARGLSANEYAFSQQSTGRLASALHLSLKTHLVRLPDDDALRAELARVRLRETSPGVVRLDHDAGEHDDQAIAVGMAVSLLQAETRVGATWLAWMRHQIEGLKAESYKGSAEDRALLAQTPHLNQPIERHSCYCPPGARRWHKEPSGETICWQCGGSPEPVGCVR